jgi:hypothetical protein
MFLVYNFSIPEEEVSIEIYYHRISKFISLYHQKNFGPEAGQSPLYHKAKF